MEQHLTSTKTFRYFTYGDIDKATKLIFVLHGYGQLAEFFIRKFHFLEEDYLIVAPEGMHRFYLKGASGRVGASWMTKEDRNSDINDNQSYLDKLYDTITNIKDFDSITLLGFSQGGATAARWFNTTNRKIDAFISWASVYPPDLMVEKNTSSKNNYFAIGKKDEYFTEDTINKEVKFYESMNFKTFTFEGTHNIDPATLNKILTQININK